MVKWFFIFLFGGIITIAVSLYFKLGAYRDVTVEIKTMPEMYFIYKKHYGAYHKISPVINSVETWALKNDIECTTSFGAYLDDPKSTDEDRLRSEGGCITSNLIEPTKLPIDFAQKKVDSKKYVVANFEGSPAIGPFVVYPKVFEWAEKNRVQLVSPTIESYKINKDKVFTTYLFNISE